MFCQKCGKENIDGSKFCINCGTMLVNGEKGDGVKKFSPALFGLIIICFFLPFTEISCNKQKIVTLTGIQLVTGVKIEQPSMFGEEKQSRRVNPEPLAILTFFSAVVGLGLSFLRSRKSAIALAVIGSVGLIMMLLLKSKIDNEALKEGGGILQIEYCIGFWFALILFLSAIALSAFLFSQKENDAEHTK